MPSEGAARRCQRKGDTIRTVDREVAVDLDANATAAPLTGVVDAMVAAMRNAPGNPASAHGGGRAAGARLAEALDAVASLICAPPGTVVLTSGGTEANNAAVRHLARRHGRIVTSSVEHASVAAPLAAVAGACDVVTVPVDGRGLLDLDRLAGTLTPGCAVAVGWANGETGVVQPVEAIAALCCRAGAVLFVDAAQAVGRVPVDLRRVPIDILSFSGHKLHGPTGTGVLFVRDAEGFEPLILGGGQQGGLRSGTVDVAGAAGLAAACAHRREGFAAHVARLRALRDRLEGAILAAVPDVAVNGAGAPRLPNTTSLRFSGADGQALVARLDAMGVRASQASACSSGRPEPSATLLAMGLTEGEAWSSLRFSVSILNTEAEIDRAADVVAEVVAALRRFSLLAGGVA